MLPKGIPETADEARRVVEDTVAISEHMQIPPHFPHSQIVALAHVCAQLCDRVDDLERKLTEKPRRGRPPKVVTAADADLVDHVAEHLSGE